VEGLAESAAGHSASDAARHRQLRVPDGGVAGYTVELVPAETRNSAAHQQIYVVKRVVHEPEGMAAHGDHRSAGGLQAGNVDGI